MGAYQLDLGGGRNGIPAWDLVYCGPVLRHPAELIQAANDRSVVTV